MKGKFTLEEGIGGEGREGVGFHAEEGEFAVDTGFVFFACSGIGGFAKDAERNATNEGNDADLAGFDAGGEGVVDGFFVAGLPPFVLFELFAEGSPDLSIEVGTGDVVGVGTGETDESFGGDLSGGGVVLSERFGAWEVGIKDDEGFASWIPFVLGGDLPWDNEKEACEVMPQEGADAGVNGAGGISHPRSS